MSGLAAVVTVVTIVLLTTLETVQDTGHNRILWQRIAQVGHCGAQLDLCRLAKAHTDNGPVNHRCDVLGVYHRQQRRGVDDDHIKGVTGVFNQTFERCRLQGGIGWHIRTAAAQDNAQLAERVQNIELLRAVHIVV